MDRLLQKLNAPAIRRLITVLVAAMCVGGTLTVVLTDGDGDGRPDHVTVTVNAAPGDGRPAATITVPTHAVEQARDSLESDLRAAPAGTPRDLLDAAGDQAASIRATETPLPTAGASQGFAGCVTRFVRDQSSRNGVRPQVQVLHYTVSPNRSGWSDVNAIVALFDTPSFQASSNFVIDGEGHCAFVVPIEVKAWTQAAANPFSISYEIINTGSESVYLAPAGLAKLRSVMREVANRTGIPLRRGAVSGCTVTRTGIVQHRDFGICGGGHGDIAPFALDPIIDYVARPGTPLTRVEQRINVGIAHPAGTGHSRRYWCQRSIAQRRAIIAAGDQHKHARRARRVALRTAAKGCR